MTTTTEEFTMGVKLRPLRELNLYERNARTHDPEQIETLMELMKEYGYTNPVLVDEDAGSLMVAGHGRHAALSNLYMNGVRVKLPNGRELPAWHIPTIDCSGWSEQQRKAYILADNQSALRAGWDKDLLRAELTDLREEGFDLALTAFTVDELEAIFEPIALDRDRDPDACPDVPPEAYSEPGDVWVCGPHRVVCGDSRSADTWARVLQGELLDAMVTDPPYNVDVEEHNRMRDRADGGTRAKSGKVENDKMSPADFLEFLRASFKAMFDVMKPGAPIYVAHSDKEAGSFNRAFVEAGFKMASSLVWRKDKFVLSRSDFQPMHEPILYGWRSGGKHRWFGGRKQTSVVDMGGNAFQKLPDGRWSIQVGDQVLIVDGQAQVEQLPGTVIYHEKPRRSEQHPTMKPCGLWTRLMTNSARAGHLVGDAFGGSGTTMIAADQLGMVARLCELSPAYVDVIVRRWQNFTGRVATNEATGLPFPVSPDTTQAF